jgi:Domain of unknown function (DUF4406)
MSDIARGQKPMKIYLAGPMTGYVESNAPVFKEAAQQLRKEGHEVFSPAEYLAPDRRQGFAIDLTWICMFADAVYLLPGWEKSTGAQCEKATAVALGLKIVEL